MLARFSISLMLLLLGSFASANENQNAFAGTLGASIEYGQLGDSGMGLKDRSMSAVSFQALPAYRINSEWLIGLDLNYRIHNQIDSLSSAGGTNLKGKSWLVGLGAQYRLNQKWTLQAAIDFLGQYKFDNQTSNAEDDHLESPLNLNLKAQYLFDPHWSVDAGASYTKWKTFHVNGVNNSEPANQWMIAVGASYHFGENSYSASTTQGEK